MPDAPIYSLIPAGYVQYDDFRYTHLPVVEWSVISSSYPSDFRLKIEAVNLYTYPDLSVICGDTQFADGRQDTFVNPTILIEVLSESTEAYVRGKKTENYRTIPSLQEYLIIAQDRPHIEHYRRQGHRWLFTEYSALDQQVALDSIGCSLSLAAIYKQIRFDVSCAIAPTAAAFAG